VPAPAVAGDAAAPPLVLPVAGSAAVAVLDSGVLPYGPLTNRVVAAWNAITHTSDVTDPLGHGTQMALLASGAVLPLGLLASDGGAAVPIIAVRAFDDAGYTSSFDLIGAVSFAVANGARVLNMSWSSGGDSTFLDGALALAQSQGALVVAAAGNTPDGRAVYPAASPGVIAVAALDSQGQPWSQSNHGAFVDVSAPGFANLPVGYNGAPGGYAGTSVASAYVAHVLARYASAHPDASGAQIAAAVTQALSPPPDGADPARYGAGMLDAAALARLFP
jgi:hypothetical protein